MTLPPNKTKIVGTIGPASEPPVVMEQMIRAGLDVARLNFSHGDFESHGRVIERVRVASRAVGRRVAIMADLPGPKMRIGQIAGEPVMLEPGAPFALTTEDIVGDARHASVSFTQLPRVVKPGDTLYLNDGVIQLEVGRTQESRVECRVVVGGELRSRKGLNLPGIDLGISAFTERDREWLRFAAGAGVDAVSQSFVESGADITAVRQAAAALGYHPFLIAKIERSRALGHMDSILEAADGIMIARGDLGVETPIEQIAVVQKRLMRQANLAGKPVITATQMLESMIESRRPTRAEATDVANAILDGTDCVMLSGESAMGKYPVEAVAMLARIAAAVEPFRPGHRVRETLMSMVQSQTVSPGDLIAISVESALERMSPAAVIIPTRTGTTARHIARFRMPVWITAVSTEEAICRGLQFSYGVYPVHAPEDPDDWKAFAREWLQRHGIAGHMVILTQGPSPRHPDADFRMEIMDLGRVTRERTHE